jgi:hypothetical protein
MNDSISEQLDRLGLGQAIAEGHLSIATLDTPEPLPTDDQIEQTIEACWGDLFGLLADTPFRFAQTDIAWGFVHIFQRAAERAERRWDDAADKVRDLLDRQDGSEIATSELENATEEAKEAETVMDAMELMRDTAAELYGRELGRCWQPLGGSRLTHRADKTSAQVDGRAFLRARTEKKRDARSPDGTPVVFAGGRVTITDTEAGAFADNLFGTLDMVRAKVPDMILIHGGDSQGLDRFASSWAQARNVAQVIFPLERRHGNRAGFVRNEKMLDLKPACVVALQGSGVLERLVEVARQRNIAVVDRRGPLCTRPVKAERQAA